MTSVSIHNSLHEVAQTPELLQRFGIRQETFAFQDLQLPYCEKIIGEDLPGQPVLVVFLHGAGSVGHDNFLQMRIPAEPLIRFLEQKNKKYVLIFPQCDTGFQWVDVPWSSAAHILPEKPSRFMAAALALFDAKKEAYRPRKCAAIGISMGGYGVWDMACRRTFDIVGVMCGGADVSQAERFRNTRICIYHGAKDPAVPVSRGRDMAAALQKAGCSSFRYFELPEALHNVWDPFFEEGRALPYLFEE